MAKPLKKKAVPRHPKKALRAGSASTYAQVTAALRDSGVLSIRDTVERHDRVLYGTGQGGMVVDVEHLKTSLVNFITDANKSITTLNDAVKPMVTWKENLVSRMTVWGVTAAVLGAGITWSLDHYQTIVAILKAATGN